MKHLFSILVLGVYLVLSSCGGGDIGSSIKSAVKLEHTNVWLQKVYFEVEEKLNNDSPVTVHLLIVFDNGLMAELNKNTSVQYFAKAEQIRRDNANNADFYAWELVPGQVLGPQIIKPSRMTAAGAVVFVRYQTPGDHRQTIGDDREVTLQLGQNDFKVVPSKYQSD